MMSSIQLKKNFEWMIPAIQMANEKSRRDGVIHSANTKFEWMMPVVSP